MAQQVGGNDRRRDETPLPMHPVMLWAWRLEVLRLRRNRSVSGTRT
ncbi:hypothetical protein [uncultured Agrococcus sp.]|nr:hypothetical protein [uncultured Agrococcus sp.]